MSGLEAVDDSDRPICEPRSTTEDLLGRCREGFEEWLVIKTKYKSGGIKRTMVVRISTFAFQVLI